MVTSNGSQRVAVITGVSKTGQVGEAVARAFAADGMHVVLIDRSGESTARAQEIVSLGHSASAFTCDLSDAAAVAQVRDAVRATHGGVDALLNVAGGFAMSGPVAESDLTVWERQIAINLTSAYQATRAFLPLLRARRGSVVFFASAAALPGARVGELSAYAVAKSGVITLMRAVAQEERTRGVRANAVAPTNIRTATNVASSGDAARYVELSEVAETVRFLCSTAASAVTGQVLELQPRG
jgi:NAD(P)-dependent dehydrogenase (short-subunit alcohol dehydrogenase family)